MLLKLSLSFSFSVILILLSCTSVSLDNKDPNIEIPKIRIGNSELHYFISNDTIFDGKDILEQKIKSSPLFSKVIKNAYAENEENFLRIKIDDKNPKLSTLIFFYLSIGTWTILPAWSREFGYEIDVQFFSRNEEVFSKKYITRRKVFLWIVVLPAVWINLLTEFESDAFSDLYDEIILEILESKK